MSGGRREGCGFHSEEWHIIQSTHTFTPGNSCWRSSLRGCCGEESEEVMARWEVKRSLTRATRRPNMSRPTSTACSWSKERQLASRLSSVKNNNNKECKKTDSSPPDAPLKILTAGQQTRTQSLSYMFTPPPSPRSPSLYYAPTENSLLRQLTKLMAEMWQESAFSLYKKLQKGKPSAATKAVGDTRRQWTCFLSNLVSASQSFLVCLPQTPCMRKCCKLYALPTLSDWCIHK